MTVYPGESMELTLIGSDVFNNPTYFIARISDNRAGINLGAFGQSISEGVMNSAVSSPFMSIKDSH